MDKIYGQEVAVHNALMKVFEACKMTTSQLKEEANKYREGSILANHYNSAGIAVGQLALNIAVGLSDEETVEEVKKRHGL